MNNQIDNLVIDGNYEADFVDYAIKYSDIYDFEFRNCNFLNSDILKLIEFKEYNRIAFFECTFEDVLLINEIKTKLISFINSKIDNYEFVYQMDYLENLTIVGGVVDIYKINCLKKLEYLRISNSNVVNVENLNLRKLKYLFIDNTNISDISFVNELDNLELLSLSEEQLLQNKEFIKKLKDNVKIVIDSFIEMEVDFNE